MHFYKKLNKLTLKTRYKKVQKRFANPYLDNPLNREGTEDGESKNWEICKPIATRCKTIQASTTVDNTTRPQVQPNANFESIKFQIAWIYFDFFFFFFLVGSRVYHLLFGWIYCFCLLVVLVLYFECSDFNVFLPQLFTF